MSSSISEVDFWWPDLKEFMATRKNATDWRTTISDGSFAKYLSDFLLHRDGGENKDKFIFERDIVCGEPASHIRVNILGCVQVQANMSQLSSEVLYHST